MTRFPLRVLETFRHHHLLQAGDRVLVALSGGPDSMALLEVLSLLLPKLGASLGGVVHVHHGLRGAPADRDLAWCREEAGRRRLPFFERQVDVAAQARLRRWSVERTAHTLRHAALAEVADEVEATRVALGHTRDDQAETVILRFLRGAGSRGLGGMWPRRGRLIRPLIDVSRAQVEQFLAERGLSSLEDETNADIDIPRNRIRHVVLPALVSVAGARLPARLARQAQAWRDDEAYLTEATAPWLAGAWSNGGVGGWRLSLRAVAGAPQALRGRIRLAMAQDLLEAKVSGRAVERIERLERAAPGRQISFGRWVAEREDENLWFRPGSSGPQDRRGDARAATAAVPVEGVVCPLPGRVESILIGLRIDATVCDSDAADRALGPDDIGLAAFDADLVGQHVVVRTWRAGDRMRPRGLGGSQKLQDLFVNRKVPRAHRARVPVITTADGRVVWVVGFAADESFAVGPVTSRVVILRATHPGGKA